MLVLTRKPGQTVVIGEQVAVAVVKVEGNKVRLGIDAPPGVFIRRNELEPSAAAERAQTAGAALPSQRCPGRQARILIVDDNPLDRALYRDLLGHNTDKQYQFMEADYGERALELCRTQSPDCVLLDYRLPDLNGVEFLEMLKDESISLPIPVVMLTRFGSEEIAVRAMKRGVADYLMKCSLTHDRLQQAVSDALGRPSRPEQMN